MASAGSAVAAAPSTSSAPPSSATSTAPTAAAAAAAATVNAGSVLVVRALASGRVLERDASRALSVRILVGLLLLLRLRLRLLPWVQNLHLRLRLLGRLELDGRLDGVRDPLSLDHW